MNGTLQAKQSTCNAFSNKISDAQDSVNGNKTLLNNLQGIIGVNQDNVTRKQSIVDDLKKQLAVAQANL